MSARREVFQELSLMGITAGSLSREWMAHVKRCVSRIFIEPADMKIAAVD